MVHSSSAQQGRNTAPNDARRHIKGLKRRRNAMAYTREQWEQRIKEAGDGRYKFVRWAIDGEFGALKKCVVRCVKDCFEWSVHVNSLVNNGCGCPQCSGVRRWTAEERVEQINKLENIEFVSWCDGYNNKNSKVNLRCTIDNFKWSASVDNLVNHESGCPRCLENRRWTAEDRIGQIKSIENINFISWVDGYKNAFSKANVKCSVDNFEWRPSVNDLVNGRCGCPKCAKYGFKLDKTGYLYALRSECGKYVKVGISNKPKQRHRQLELATPFSFSCIEQIYGDGVKIYEIEKYFHEKYERAGFTGFDGCTEWLICTPQLLEELIELEDVK